MCAEKQRLAREFQEMTQSFADAVLDLQQNLGTLSKAAYEQRRRVTDEHRMKSEHARIALEQHVATHGC